MRTVLAVFAAAALVAAAANADDPARCRLRSGLYEQRLALAAAPQPAANGGASTDGPAAAMAGVVREYGDFFQALSDAMSSSNPKDVPACCSEAGGDRIGAMSCQLATYLAAGRVDPRTFLTSFPSAKKDAVILWDMDGIAAATGDPLLKVFQPKGPSFRFIDELFLLMLDGNEEAIAKYFSLAAAAAGESSRYMDDKLVVLLRESPATLVSNWFVLRKHKAKFKTVVQSFTASSKPPEIQQFVRTVRVLCREDDPDCQEILKMFPKK